MDYKAASKYTGLAIVIGTHVGMILDVIPMTSMFDKQLHSYANLVAAGLIIYGTT